MWPVSRDARAACMRAPKTSVIPGVRVIPVEEAPPLAHTKPVGVPNLPAEIPTTMGLEEFKAKLDEVKPNLPGWRYREIVQEFVMVENYRAGDEFDAMSGMRPDDSGA